MSDVAIIVVCLTIIVITAIVSAAWYNLHKIDPIEEARQELRAAEKQLFSRTLKKSDPEPEPDSMAPIPVDPKNPPVPRTYNRRPGSTAPVPKCFCHGQELQSGQEILWWPVPNSGEVKIYCQREDA